MAVCCSQIVLDKKVQRVTRLGSTHVSMVHKKEVPIQCSLYLWAISSVFLDSRSPLFNTNFLFKKGRFSSLIGMSDLLCFFYNWTKNRLIWMATIGHKSENVDMADLFCWGQFLRLSRTYLFMFWLQADVFMAIDIFCQLNVSGMSNLCDIFVKQEGRHFVRSTVLIVLGTILSGLKFNFKYSYQQWLMMVPK